MREEYKPAVLTIAGFDPGSGAGISADLKTFHSIGVYGVGLISCLTVQNHDTFGGISEVDPDFFKIQFSLLMDGYDIKSVKTGLLTRNTIKILGNWKKENPGIPLISDPVFTATSGKIFFEEQDSDLVKDNLLKYADLITPNIQEASILSGMNIENVEDMLKAGRKLAEELNTSILIKGGHLRGCATDILFVGNCEYHFNHPLIAGVNTHGSGCILSAAIAAFIACGSDLSEAVSKAKEFISGLVENPVTIDRAGRIIDP